MCPIDINRNYKSPSEEEINSSQNFDRLFQKHTSKQKTARLKTYSAIALLVVAVATILFYIFSDKNKTDSTKNNKTAPTGKVHVSPEKLTKKEIIIVPKDSMIDTFKLINKKNIRTLKKGKTGESTNFLKSPAPSQDLNHETEEIKSENNFQERPIIKQDTSIKKPEKEVIIKNNKGVIYKRNMEELEKELHQRYSRPKRNNQDSLK